MQPEAGELRARLEAVVGAAHVDVGPVATGPFAVDGVAPTLTVRPGSQEEVAKVVAACAAAEAALTPWGGGTSMGLGNPPTRADVVVRLDRLNRIVEHDADNLNVSVEAGLPLAQLAATLAERRQFLPLDAPADAKATIGGLLAVNAMGPWRLLYGAWRDWVLGLRVVLPDGERIRCGGKVIKNVSGYDMNKLFIGSLGSLGIITEATVKLLPLPAARATVVGLFPELAQATDLVGKLLDSVLLPEAMELLSPGALSLLAPALGLGAPAGYGLAVSLAGSPQTVERQVQEFSTRFGKAQASRLVTLAGEQAASAWQATRDVFERLPGPERVICKIAVPISRCGDLLAAAEQLGRRHKLRTAVIAHAGSGVVRAGYLPGPQPPPPQAWASGVEELRREAEAAEGSLVIQAAPPALKAHVDAWGKPGEGFGVMRRLKAEFDPRSLCNPGRFLGGI